MDYYKVETWNNYQSSSPNMDSAVTQFSTHNATVRRMGGGGGGGEKEVVWSRKPIFSWSNNTKVNFGCTGNFLGQLPHRSQGSRGVVQGKVLPWIQSWHEPWIFLGWWKLDFKVRVKAFTTLARPPIWLPCTRCCWYKKTRMGQVPPSVHNIFLIYLSFSHSRSHFVFLSDLSSHLSCILALRNTLTKLFGSG